MCCIAALLWKCAITWKNRNRKGCEKMKGGRRRCRVLERTAQYLHSTCNATDSWTLRCNASLLLWHVYTMPFISCVTLIFNSSDETVPPHNPCFDALFIPSTGMPSFQKLNLAGGLLELESQMSVASTPGTSSAGSTRILTFSGATVQFLHRNKHKTNGKKEEKN